VQNPRGYVTTNVYNARDLIARTDALGQTASFTYDALGRQVEVQTPLGYRTSTVYDVVGQVAVRVDASAIARASATRWMATASR
jgi:YD repeat-containing protein